MGLKYRHREWRGRFPYLFGILGAGVICFSALAAEPYVYTATESYVPDAWACGGERFPQGAAIQVVSASGTRELARGFFASADPEVSFDGQRVLFSGKPRRGDPWQIWEVSANGGGPHRIAGWPEDSIRPLYLPGDKIVYARKMAWGFQLEVLAITGGQPLRITFAPGNVLTCDVLHDGRVLYEGNNELYTVYPDGSGVEAYRCEHGPSRHGARQMASRDVVFDTGAGLARFTSAMATQTDVSAARGGEFAGPVAEFGPEAWLVSFRSSVRLPFQIYKMDPVHGLQDEPASAVGVQPVRLAAREVPLRFPSGLHDWEGANVLCLNAYTSKSSIVDGSIDSVRLYSAGAAEQPILLGETQVESDGSFFLHVPSERPLRMELRDRSGRTIVAEHGWFWMRRGEQRVCVGCHAGPERAPENAVPKVLLRKDVPVRMTGESR
jgi:hypothetical protein